MPIFGMVLDWDAPQQDWKAHFTRFGREVIAPRAQALAMANAFDQEGWTQLCQTDFFHYLVAEEYGGKGIDLWKFSAGMEGLASEASDGGFVLTAVAQAGFLYGLGKIGSADQRAHWLPRLLAGELTATAIAETHSGSDVGGLRTQAVQEGDQLLLSGEKWNIAHAPTASVCLVVGKMPAWGKRDLCLFLVDRELPGFSSSEPDDKLGHRTLPTGALQFERIPLGPEHVLGPPEQGFKSLAQVVTLQRIYYGWMGSRLILPLLREAMAFLEKRSSLGRGLLQHQHVQRKISETLLSLEESRLAGLNALSRMLQGHPLSGLSSSVAKLSGARAALQGSQDLMSLMGSQGYQSGLASHLVKDALGLITAGGTEEMHHINLFRQFVRFGKDLY